MIKRGRLLKAPRGGDTLVGSGPPRLLGHNARTARKSSSIPLEDGQVVCATLPGKRPLIRLSASPPNYEVPVDYLRTVITPSDAFFVRYNLSDIPRIDPATWTLTVGGEGANKQAKLSLDDLQRLPAIEVVAVCQCSGNRRRLFEQHIPGVQWGHGAVGCGRWRGARLKDVLDAVGLKKGALEITFDGADKDAFDETPDFIKSLPVWKAVTDSTLVAYEMNGRPLPHLHGFPARLVVPGWTATYWVKHLTSIMVATEPFDGYWMKSTYRVPLGSFPAVAHFISQESAVDTPVTEMMVNSLITSPEDGAAVNANADVTVSGIAWDGGYGIRSVEVSSDEGKTWAAAALGRELGPFAFRPWSHSVAIKAKGRHVVMARATNRIGQSQTWEPISNPAGYHHNGIQAVTLMATR